MAGVVVALASAAVVGTRLRHEPSTSTADAAPATSASPSVTTPDAASAAGSTPEQTTQAVTPPEAPAQATAGNPSSDASTGASQPAPEASAAVAPVEIKQLPPNPTTPRPTRRTATKNASAAEQPREEPPTVVSEPVPRAPPAAPTHVATQSAVSHPRDRWARMDDELSRCTREDFIARVVCGQRVRFRYCSGYWGKVSQCPGSPTPEHGQ
ncbi:MAG TPA: hypothetical protein VKV24_00925 [Casimicrobiaceae bacterium]|nr:hypothetical protein [Casimicrobiaceae bacterium]